MSGSAPVGNRASHSTGGRSGCWVGVDMLKLWLPTVSTRSLAAIMSTGSSVVWVIILGREVRPLSSTVATSLSHVIKAAKCSMCTRVAILVVGS